MNWGWFSKVEKKDVCEEDPLQCAIAEYEKVQTQKDIIVKKSRRETSDLLNTVNGALDILNKVEAKRNK